MYLVELNRKNLVRLLLLRGESSSVMGSHYLAGSVAHCEQTDLFVCSFVNFIFEILVFWRTVCLNLCGRLVLQTEGQLHSNKDVRTEFVILTATS